MTQSKQQQSELVSQYGLVDHVQWNSACDQMIRTLNLNRFKQCLIIDAEFPNAYSMAHGVLILTKGMLVNIKNSDQLAHILAHEHAHITLNHHQQSQQIVNDPPIFFTKSKIKKFYRKIEKQADLEANKILQAHQMDPSQINHLLIRIAELGDEKSNDHVQLKKRINHDQLTVEKVEDRWTNDQ